MVIFEICNLVDFAPRYVATLLSTNFSPQREAVTLGNNIRIQLDD